MAAGVILYHRIHKLYYGIPDFGTGDEIDESALMDDFQASRVDLSLVVFLLCTACLRSCPQEIYVDISA
jgi:hypothetical protein